MNNQDKAREALKTWKDCVECAEYQMECTFNELCNNLPVAEAFAYIEAALTTHHQQDMLARLNDLEGNLVEISNLFSDIRGDWSDPRAECRAGQNVVSTAQGRIEEIKKLITAQEG
jgi:hypothetical protein